MSQTTALPQPIPYQGSKRQLAPRVCAHLGGPVRTLYEPFAGSAALSLYAASRGLAQRFVLGEALPELAALWRRILDDPEAVADAYAQRWERPEAYSAVRDEFNRHRNPLDLHYLLVRCVKNAVRFSAAGNFSQSADQRRLGTHPARMRVALRRAGALLQGRTEVRTGDWLETASDAGAEDLAYLDPPWLGTSSGPDRRYGLQLSQERLVEGLQRLQAQGVPLLLSYDGRTGDAAPTHRLPPELGLTQHLLDAGRSSQATLLGRTDRTWESLYVWRPGA